MLYDPKIYEQLVAGGVDKLMAQHVAHLFIRFTITITITTTTISIITSIITATIIINIFESISKKAWSGIL